MTRALAVAAVFLLTACGAPQEPPRYAEICGFDADGLRLSASSDALWCDFEDRLATAVFDGPGAAEVQAGRSRGSIVQGARASGRTICRMDRWGRGGCLACPAPGMIDSDFARRVVADRLDEAPAGDIAEPPPARDVDEELAVLRELCTMALDGTETSP